jgi:hypothetical protein
MSEKIVKTGSKTFWTDHIVAGAWWKYESWMCGGV